MPELRIEITTGEATDITSSSATLNGQLTGGWSDKPIEISFEYGTSTSYGKEIPVTLQPVPPPVPGRASHIPVTGFSAYVTDLTPGTVYHFRARASVESKIYFGEDKVFTTHTPPIRIDEIEGGLPPEMVWERTFGGAGDDGGYAVITADDGGYVIAGYTGSQGAGGKDAWLIKTDSQGQKLWDYTFGGAGDDVIHSIIRTADNDYVLAGYTGSGATGTDYWLIKTDSRGRKLWEKTFDSTLHDLAGSVIETDDGGYLIAGHVSIGADGRTWLVKTDSRGERQWDQVYGGSFRAENMSVIQTADGGYIFTCATFASPVRGYLVYVEKIDAAGNRQWAKDFGGEYEYPFASDKYSYSIVQATDGGYIIAGTADHRKDISEAINHYAWLIKTDGDGNKQWDRSFGGEGSDIGKSVIGVDGGYVVTGKTGNNAFLLGIDYQGNKQWGQIIEGAEGTSVIHSGDGGFVITGTKEGKVWLAKAGGENGKDKPPLETPAVTTCDARQVKSASATLDGELNSPGSASRVQVYFEWGTSTKYGNQTKPQDLNKPEVFSSSLSGLKPATIYHYRAVAVGDGEAKGENKTFTTLPEKPEIKVITGEATDITETTAILQGELIGWSSEPISLSFEWGETSAYGNEAKVLKPAPSVVPEKTIPGSRSVFSTTLTGLTPGTTYYYRAIAVGDGTAKGEGKSFTTAKPPTEPPAKPSVTTTGAASVTSSGAALHGELTGLGSASAIQVCFEWGTSSMKYTSQTIPRIMTSKDKFSFNLTGLLPDTGYYFRARAEDIGKGITVYGSERSFTTQSPPPPQPPPSAPQPQPPPPQPQHPQPPEGDATTVIITNNFVAETSVKINVNNVIQNSVKLKTRDEKARLDIGEKTRVQDDKGQAPEAFTVNVLALPAGPSTDETVIQAYEFGPPGTLFEPPITLTLQYDPQTIPSGAKEADLTIANWDGTKWIAVQSEVDTLLRTISAKISRFGKYALLATLPVIRSAKFSYSPLEVTPAQVRPGEPVDIRITVSNTGSSQGMCTLILKINNNEIETRPVSMDAGISEKVIFEVKTKASGEYTADINGMVGSFTVLSPETKAAAPLTVWQRQEAQVDAGDSPASPDAGLSQPETRGTFPVFWIIVIALVIAGLTAVLVSALRRRG